METSQLSGEIDKNSVYERLEDLLFGVGWQFEDLRKSGKRYVRYYRDGFNNAPAGQPKVYSENWALLSKKEKVLNSSNAYIVQIASCEREASADLLTSFAIDVGTGSLVVSQLEGPGQNEVNPGITLYGIYGIDKRPVDEQWRALQEVIS